MEKILGSEGSHAHEINNIGGGGDDIEVNVLVERVMGKDSWEIWVSEYEGM